jgi:hypothetical protein
MPVEIVELLPSDLPTKRFKIVLNVDGHDYTYNFGAREGSTYVDHGDKKKRENYRRRHYANATEKFRIDNLVPSPSLFAWKLLWGDKTDLLDNLIELQREFNHRFK